MFARRSGVCEGYARLMTALGKAAGIEIAYVTGYIRDSERRLAVSDDPWDTSQGHAWNAVKLDDGWHLIEQAGESDHDLPAQAVSRRHTSCSPAFTPELHSGAPGRW